MGKVSSDKLWTIGSRIVEYDMAKLLKFIYLGKGFKKQEELKKISEANDDYLHSSWADPKKLQKPFPPELF